MARVLLINPTWTKRGSDNLWTSVEGCWPSPALGIIASILENKGHEIKIFDAPAMHVALDEVEDYLRTNYNDFKPDFIGISITTILSGLAYETTKYCKKVWPKCKVIAGGVHATAEPEETISQPTIDVIVRDEGDFTFAEIIDGKPYKNILGISYKKNGKQIHTPKRPYIKKLDDLPMPAYHLLPMEKYHPATGTYRKLPAMILITSRGCPGKCTFCYQPYGTMVRQKSAKKIFEEAKLLIEKYGIKELCFYDDNFCTYQENVKELCQLLIDYQKENKIKLSWNCFTRVDWIEEETVKLMKKSGCHCIMFGVESANQKVLENIKKNIDLKMVIEAHKIIKRNGINTRANFMFGNPGETEKTMKQTIKFAIKLDPTIVQFNILAPNPGTEVYKWAKEKGYLEEKHWEDYDLYTPIMRLPTVSPETLKKYYRMGYRKFYFRPKYILKRLIKLYDPIEMKNAFNGLKAVISVTKG